MQPFSSEWQDELSRRPLSARPTVDNSALGAYLKPHRLTVNEYRRAQDLLGRNPTEAEIGIFSALWSEHCSYKSSKHMLRTLPTSGEGVVQGPGENAGVVRVHGKLCAAFKMESHNHPSYIAPYQGAATGVGGILRDVFCMGARPIANLNCLRFGRRDHPKTRFLLREVVAGIAGYGNAMGIATVAGSVAFDRTYDGNCLVNAMTVGLVAEDEIFTGHARGIGNWVVYAGSATGRDGVHGATMASASFDSAATHDRATIQVGDPFAEKLLLEATLELLKRRLVIGLQDMGAAGLTSSSFEMAERAGHGMILDLDRVPTRARNMTAYELLLSESQERMLYVIEPRQWSEVEAIFKRWDISYGVIGTVTDSGRMIIHYQGELVADVPLDRLSQLTPKYERAVAPDVPGGRFGQASQVAVQGFATWLRTTPVLGVWSKLLQERGCHRMVYEQYDHDIGTSTVHGPEDGGAAVIKVRGFCADVDVPDDLALVLSSGCLERAVALNPYTGAQLSLAKVARSIFASGGELLGVTDCLNFGNPEVPRVMSELSRAIAGLGDACRALGVPVVSGNVSLYNETDGVQVLPTPMLGVVGRLKSLSCGLSATARGPGQRRIVLLTPKAISPSFAASLVLKVAGFQPHESGDELSDNFLRLESQAASILRDLAHQRLISVARDVGEGGVLCTLWKMIEPERLGFSVRAPQSLAPSEDPQGARFWFGDRVASYLFLADDAAHAKINTATALGQGTDMTFVDLGTLENNDRIWVDGVEIPRDTLQEAYNHSLDWEDVG